MDLVQRLRGGVYGINRIPLCIEAADEIERLRAEEQRLCSVVASVNSKCDHLGMRLGEVIRERNKLLEALRFHEQCVAAIAKAMGEK